MRKQFTALVAFLVVGLALSQAMALTTISNGIYDVHVASIGEFSTGSWNAITGATHPVGFGRNILYTGSVVSTNSEALRIFSPTGALTFNMGGHGASNLSTFATSEGPSAFGANGHQTVYTLSAQNLVVKQDLVIAGSTYNNSGIYHTVQIINTSTSSAVKIGWRNLYDWNVNDPSFDDGPSNQAELANGTVLVPATVNEFAITPVANELIRVTAAPPPGGGPTYQPLLALGFDPGFIPALPVTLPTEYDFADWPNSISTGFDYTVNPFNSVSDDCSGLSWFGRDDASGISIPAGGSVRFTQVIFGVTPDAPPPGGVPEPVTATLGTLSLIGLALTATRRQRA